jgi:hypothetical protein
VSLRPFRPMSPFVDDFTCGNVKIYEFESRCGVIDSI